ncbi:hypothetical protein ZWY2020_014644 [Hordeum vulgare]|nr:hypothetical protein ZWY2020_014644 [Hordeum vulgare]
MSGGDAQEQDYASPLGATGLHPSICSRGEAEGASLNILHPTCLPTPKSVRTHPPSARIATPRFPDHRAETGSPVSPSAARGRRRAPSRNGSSGGLAFVGASDPPLASRLQAEVVKRIEERESLLVMAGDRCAGAIAGCELCGGVAAVHCAADSAFLCVPCDAKVHGANFLASRHLRRRLVHAAAGEGEDSESESSSSCVSTADSCSAAASAAAGRRRPGCKHRRARAEAVLEGWAKRMGLAPGTARRRAARAAGALRALGRGVSASRVPLRVAMAAALWSEVAGSGCGDATLLRRLEASSHVPARLVVTVASWMARTAARAAAPAPAEEGWAECS